MRIYRLNVGTNDTSLPPALTPKQTKRLGATNGKQCCQKCAPFKFNLRTYGSWFIENVLDLPLPSSVDRSNAGATPQEVNTIVTTQLVTVIKVAISGEGVARNVQIYISLIKDWSSSTCSCCLQLNDCFADFAQRCRIPQTRPTCISLIFWLGWVGKSAGAYLQVMKISYFSKRHQM